MQTPRKTFGTEREQLQVLTDVREMFAYYIGTLLLIGWGTALQTGRSRVRFPMASLELFIEIILPAALWPWG